MMTNNMLEGECPLCHIQTEYSQANTQLLHHVNCPNCGPFQIALDIFEDFKTDQIFSKYGQIISGYVKERSCLGKKIIKITHENFQELLNGINPPKSPIEKMERLLLNIYRQTDHFGASISLNTKFPAIAYAKNETEIKAIYEALSKEGLIESTYNIGRICLTIDGFKRIEQIQAVNHDSRQFFMAMHFTDEMKSLFNNHINPAIESIGYNGLIIANHEHNNDINDEIISEIRKSRFLIADFTGIRGGVYFEAGYAKGIGIPVIWTCKKADFDNTDTKPHFDIEHYNFILRENAQDLTTKLINRINATIF